MGSAGPSQTIILITGANQGLGFETVKNLAANQPNFTILLGSRNHTNGINAAKSVTPTAANTTVIPVQLDITSDESIASAVDFVGKEYGRLDILFNNAGIYTADDTREEWARVYNTNTLSVWFTAKAFIPLLLKSTLPKLVFMSSGLGSVTETLDPDSEFYGYPQGSYSVSKSAMNMVAAQLAVTYRNEGVKVNVVDPGHNATYLNNYNTRANQNIADGALEAVKVILEGKDGRWGTYSRTRGSIPW